MRPAIQANLDHLDRIERKLDQLLAQHAAVGELIDDGMHMAREATAGLSPTLLELERKGWFAMATEVFHVLDEVVEGYGPSDVRGLADNIVGILDTVRNMTQPDVLAMANEATDVLHHASDVAPVGPLGMLSATRDDDVRHGLAVMLEVLRRVGQATGAATTTTPVRRAAPAPSAPATSRPAAATPAPSPAAVVAPSAAAAIPTPTTAPGFDGGGFLTDPMAWTPELATRIAAEANITLTDDHWRVVTWIREEHARSGVSPNVRRISQGAQMPIADLYRLFPNGPGKTAARIAGVPKPAGCI